MTFLQVVEDVALGPDCRDHVERHGALHFRGTAETDRTVHADDDLVSFSAFEACEQKPTPVAVRLSGTTGEATYSCSGFRVDRCDQEAPPEIAVYGTFDTAGTWAAEQMWHMDRADLDGKEEFTKIPRELKYERDLRNGFVLLQREKGPDELVYAGERVSYVGPAVFPKVDGRFYLYQEGRLHELSSKELPVVFERFAVTLPPYERGNEYY